MRILYICDEYPPGKNGGIGTMVQMMARQMVSSGHSVTVIGLYEYAYGSQDFEIDEGVEVHRLRYAYNFKDGSLLLRIYKKLPRHLKRLLIGKQVITNYVNQVQAIVKDKKIDIVEIADWSSLSFETGIGIEWPQFDCAMLVKLHGSYTYFQTELKQRIVPQLFENDDRLLKRADAIASVSAYTAERTRNLFDLQGPIKVLHNAIAVPPLNETRKVNSTDVFFSGSLVPKKGIYQLMKAWNMVIEKKPDARLWVYGKGPINGLKALLKPAVLPSVNFEGHVSRLALMDRLSNSALAVFPSYSETFGLMCIEAMSMACAVIYTKRSCGPEIITDGVDGALVDPDNVHEIAEKILALLSDHALRKKYAENGYQTLGKRFSIEKSEQDHVAFYEALIQAYTMKQKNFNFTT
ncbi:MAG: glycosyltransferase family 4 protein [Bacteroidota bacterium]